MPSSKEREVDTNDRPREKKHKLKTERKDSHKRKDRDRDRDKENDRDRDHDRSRDRDRDREDSLAAHRHHKSSRSSKSSKHMDCETGSRLHHRHRTKDRERGKEREKDRDIEKERRVSMEGPSSIADLVPELARSMSRVSIPYPNFNKAHSKDAIYRKEDLSGPAVRRTDPLTPEATDLGRGNMKRSKSMDSSSVEQNSSEAKTSEQEDRPPSPPETETEVSAQQKQLSGTLSSGREGEERSRSKASLLASTVCKKDPKPDSHLSSNPAHVGTSVGEPRQVGSVVEDGFEVPSTTRSTSTTIPGKRAASASTARPSSVRADDSPDSVPDSSPMTPTLQLPACPPPPGLEKQPISAPYEKRMDNSTRALRLPPPPPPPPLKLPKPPRVDYLIQNGGLPNLVSKDFLAVLPRQNGFRPSVPPLRGAETLFAPFFNLLDQYQSVLSKNGSIAVATGHRTVARRLLDRLENVFSRDLSPNGCSCVICEDSGEAHRGLGWGEVLERVSGRIDLPQWPPFDMASLGSKAVEEMAGIPARPASPIKMDPDIAEEFREHYLRQSQKVRSAVDRWMSSCDRAPAPTPQEVDDETLTFAILTNLDIEDRPYFNALVNGTREMQTTIRGATPMRKGRSDLVVKTGLSLQRLYRLTVAPRDAETAVYLVKNRGMHDLLHTITDISQSEWEILTSGRFDGFLWSGADDDFLSLPPGDTSRRVTPADMFSPSRSATLSPAMGRYTPGLMNSRNATPFSPFSSYSRGATPASFASGLSSTVPLSHRGAVSHDEETEIAVLAEVEREIFAGMEALEDAFETLHQRAEQVRTALRQRGAGLQMSLQQRRGLGIDVLPMSGSSGVMDRPGWLGDDESVVSESEWGGDDISEIVPDDSASNVSSARHRRPKRRKERVTPAPIEEEDE